MQQTCVQQKELLTIYAKEVSKDKYKPLPLEIEKELVNLAKNGDKKAESQLINAHLRLVINIAKRIQNERIDILDLVQEGNLGLYEALRKFDSSKNVRFCVYAEWWIRKFIYKVVYDKQRLNETEVLINNTHTESIDDGIICDNDSDDFFVDDNNENNEQEYYTSTILELLEALDERSRLIIEYFYGVNNKDQLTLIEIAKKLNVTPERVRQLKDKAMIFLRSQALSRKKTILEKL